MDAERMRRALELAEAAEGSVAPRPPVGAVVCDPDGLVVGEGATHPEAGPHAEVAALAQAGARARGATLYVTLEPCCFTGRTPPCTEAVIAAGLSRVVVARRDPHPRVNGAGMAALRTAGIDVVVGPGRVRAGRLIEPFVHHVRTGRPMVTLKAAMTLDGKVAAPDRTSRWISSEDARRQAHDLRRRCDAVLVGAGTVEADDPALTCRLDGVGAAHQPVRVVTDRSGRTPPTAKIFHGGARSIVMTTQAASDERRAAWSAAGAEVVVLAGTETGVSPGDVLDALGARGVCHLLVEGGPTLAASFVEAGLVDRYVLFLAPKLIGGEAPGLLTHGVKTLTEAHALRIDRVSRVGEDIRIDGRPS